MGQTRRRRGSGDSLGPDPPADDEFAARAGRNAVKLIFVFVAAIAIVTGSIGLYGAWRVENAPERFDDGGVECGEDLENRTLRQLKVCP